MFGMLFFWRIWSLFVYNNVPLRELNCDGRWYVCLNRLVESQGRIHMAGVSIIVPTMNEADNINPLLERIFSAEFPDDVALEVVVVDDSSTDDTRSRVREWSTHKPVSLICREKGNGLANAVVVGAKSAAHEFVLVMDADLSHPPEKIGEMVLPLLDGSCDMVIGSRYVKGGSTPQWPLSRKIASKLASLPAYLFTDANDPMAGFFATSTKRLASLRPDIPGFKIGLELLAVEGQALRVVEIPIVFYDRFEGFSKMNKMVIFDYLKQVLQLVGFDTPIFTPMRLVILTVLGVLINTLLFQLLTTIHSDRLLSHVSSLTLAGTVLSYSIYRLWKGVSDDRVLKWRHFFGGIFSLIVSISLQGGLFVLLNRVDGLSVGNAFFCSSLVGTGGFIALMVFFVFSGFQDLENRVRLKISAISLVVFGALLRLLYIGIPELMEQEAYYWNYANHIDISYLDHPPMAATLIWLGTALFGVNEFGVRIAAYCCWLLAAYFSFRLTLKIFGRTAAIGSVALLAWLPFYLGAGLIMTPDAPLLAAWSAVLYFLYAALVEERKVAWFGVGISLGLGMISKYTIVLLGPGILAFMLFDKNSRRWFLRFGPYGAVIIALLLFSPVVIWNYQHEWASFLFQGEQRVTGRTFFTTHRLAGYITLILTPAGVLAALYFFIRGNWFFKTAIQRCSRAGGRLVNRNYSFLLMMTLSPLLVFLIFSFTREVKLNWTGPLWLSAIPFLSCTSMAVFGGVASKFLQSINWLWKPTLVGLALSAAIVMHYVTFGLPGVPHPPGPILIGWNQFARDIEQLVEEVELETGERPVVIGMDPYQISSGLAFYRTKNRLADGSDSPKRGISETLGWHFFGWNSLMYSYWAKPEDYKGSNIIVVASSKKRAESPYFQKRVKREKPIFPLSVKKNGQVVRQFYVRQLYDYRPRPFRKI